MHLYVKDTYRNDILEYNQRDNYYFLLEKAIINIENGRIRRPSFNVNSLWQLTVSLKNICTFTHFVPVTNEIITFQRTMASNFYTLSRLLYSQFRRTYQRTPRRRRPAFGMFNFGVGKWNRTWILRHHWLFRAIFTKFRSVPPTIDLPREWQFSNHPFYIILYFKTALCVL